MKTKHASKQLFIGILAVVAAATEALFGLFLGETIDAIELKQSDLLISLLLSMIALVLVNTATCIWVRVMMYRDASEQVDRLKGDIYSVQIRKVRREAPDIANFTSKIDLLFQDYYMGKQFVLIYVATFICSCTAIISIHWFIFLIAFFCAAVPFLVPVVFKKTVQKAAAEYAEESTEYTGFVTDTLYGRMEIVKYRVTAEYMKKHGIADYEMESRRVNSLKKNYEAEKSTEAVANFMQIAVLLAGGFLVYHDMITVGNVVSVVQLMGSTIFPLTAAVNYVNRVNACKPVLESLNSEVNPQLEDEGRSHESCAEEKGSENRMEQCLYADHISYHYPGEERIIVNDFTYRFETGKKYLIKGESGSGKTTLAKLLSGELMPTEGSIQMEGEIIGEVPAENRSLLVNYAEQQSYLFHDDVLHNITLYRNCSEDEEKELRCAMDDVQLKKISLDTVISDSNGLSGGEKSRICLLRAMYAMPKVLIADEPTSALDGKNTETVIERLLSCKETVIVISHNLSDVLEKKFDDTIVI